MTDDTDANARFGAISKLPVFLDLSGRRALLAGDTPGLAWKAELIAAAGARVLILSARPSPELLALIHRGASAGSLALERRAWTPADLAGAAVAVADLETQAEADAFSAAGLAAGVIVNTIDKGATCDFYFGAIVSRTPIVIGATTDGTAPILGQAIRRRIELAVPEWLGPWAEFGRTIRPEVKRRLAPGRARRAFWETFAEAALAAPLDAAAEAGMRAALSAAAPAPARAPGVRDDIDAPSSADELTLGAVKRLQAADVLIEAAGVAPDIRAFYRREATRLVIGQEDGPGRLAASSVEARIAAEMAGGRRVVLIRPGSTSSRTAS